MSTRVLIAYDFLDGHCAHVAARVAEGVQNAGASAIMKKVTETVRADFRDLDGLILGSPVHQRGMSWQMKKFIDEMCEPSWFYDDMVGRVCGVFTTGGGHGDAGGGCELAQLSMLGNLASMGMIMVPFPKITRGFDFAGMHWGPHVRITGPDMQPLPPQQLNAEALEGGYHHGAAIARVAAALKQKSAVAAIFDGGGRFPPPELLRDRSAKEDANGAQGEPR